MSLAISPGEVDLALRDALSSSIQNLDAYVSRPGKDFSRNSKLDITTMATTIITMGEHDIRSELKRNPGKQVKQLLEPVLVVHRPKHNPPKCKPGRRLAATSSAFTLKRKLLSPRFFEDAFYEFIRLTHRGTYTFKGLHVLAVDGSDIRIPPNPADPDYYIEKSDGSAPYNQLHLDVFYDVLERTFVAASTCGKNKSDEREVAINLMRKCMINKAILTADRGYESYNFLAHVLEKGWFYLIRAKDVDSKGILSGLPVPREGEFDVLFDLNLTKKDTTEVRQLEWDHPEKFKRITGKKFDFLPEKCLKDDPMSTYHLPLRIVRIQVEENKYECLLTNLDSEEFPPELLKELYHLRWGVEDAFRKLKYALSVLDVHSRKAVCVEQEVFGRMIMYNYTQLMLNYADETREASPENKHEYRPSFTKGVGSARCYLNGTITRDEMLAYMKQELEPIRPGRKQPRKMTPKKPHDYHYRGAGG